MQHNSLKVARQSSVQQKVRDVSIRLSIAAAILGSSVVGVASPLIARAHVPDAQSPLGGQESIVGRPDVSLSAPVARYYGPYSPETYEAFVAAHQAVTISDDFSRYEPKLYLDYLAQISPKEANDQSTEFNPNSSGAAYRPYVPSIGYNDQTAVLAVATPEPVDLMGAVYADSQTPIEQQTQRESAQPSGPYNAPATPIASVDLMRGIYADSQMPIEQQVHQQSQAVEAAPISQVSTSDRLRGVYGDNVNLAVSIPYRSPVLPDQNDGRDNLVITPDGWFVSSDVESDAPVAPIAGVDLMRDLFKDGTVDEEAYLAFLASRSTSPSVAAIDGVDLLRYVYENGHVSVDVLNNMLLAQGRAPVIARPPVSRALARGVIGDELFLYSVTKSPVAEENEPSQMQAIVPSHSGLAM